MDGGEGPRYLDEIATGMPAPKLDLAGRIRRGSQQAFVILEEPGEPVLMHWKKTLVPHYKKNCPHCKGATEEPKPFIYVGACRMNSENVILELNWKCFSGATVCATTVCATRLSLGQKLSEVDLFGQPRRPTYVGLLVVISRADFDMSPRVLRCHQRAKIAREQPWWPYETRRELARIWGIPIKPRLWKAEGGSA
jgi:hypothetical protein